MSRPKVTKLDPKDLEHLSNKDFFPHRQTQEDNTLQRMEQIEHETKRLFQHSPGVMPQKEEFPTLYQELPTLWAMIEEGKFRYWREQDQSMMLHMIELRKKVLVKEISHEDAEHSAGDDLANRFLYPLVGKMGGGPSGAEDGNGNTPSS